MIRYAGIGSRESPPNVLKQMEQFGYLAATNGWILRSGGAIGADTAFELGCDRGQGRKEIFLPWPYYEDRKVPYAYANPTTEAHQIASTIHPIYKKLSDGKKKMVARNMHQILGLSLTDPVDCVVCWTKDGMDHHIKYSRETGGTGSAICLASKYSIPIFNLQHPTKFWELLEFFEDIRTK